MDTWPIGPDDRPHIQSKPNPGVPGPDKSNPNWNSYETFVKNPYQFPPYSDVNAFLIPDANLIGWNTVLNDWLSTPSRNPPSYYQFGPLSPLSQKIWKSSRGEFMEEARKKNKRNGSKVL